MGSWKVRAQQMAAARPHWHAVGNLESRDLLAHQLYCAVKRPFRSRLRLLRALGKVTVYDIVDCWAQPADGLRYRDATAIRGYFKAFFADLPVDGVIFPNRTMLEDLGDLVPNPIHIYHHFWPGLEPITVREQAQVVGYQGEPEYLGPWRAAIERACHQLGLRFVVNPRSLRDLDIGFAARGGIHAVPMAHRYKSNIKLANFYGAGLPCLVHAAELSYQETDNGEVRFFTTENELRDRLAELLPYEARMRVHRSFLATREHYTLEAVAQRYETYFQGLLAPREV